MTGRPSLSPSKQALDQCCHPWPWPGRAPPPPCVMRISFPIFLLYLILFLNFVTLQDLRSRPGWSRSQNQCLLSSWGHSHQTLCPLLDLYLGTNRDLSHPNSCTRGIRYHLGFLHQTISLRSRVGSPPVRATL